ncbi:electron transport complex, RnfABCDGE type, B subunit [Ferrimonas balearica DSM 9799]|uniref:Ion-translocating oxidoreductase complex subunit B n=1 Tax=Ferrimonas balearica (strain DSM 9799 / CCM 4581 / KCTC 23876 / PAT) TaxID=550540 RepID=E1SWF7_FERBD|nr:electron transport complex subunit RsxB [Ferrimonas balearica]ADN76439.1 electron transport complex, RnfABCDGE type, B subunit [Ferrimonas balearica DSM 9799]
MSSIVFAILALAGLALIFGVLLGYAAIRFKVEGDPMVEQIEQALPQTQCGQCGFPGCRPYAEAIAKGEAPINRCPPGGEATVQKLADMLGVEPEPLDADADSRPKVAYIREAECIGCTKCIQACPVDAIIGTGKQMHTVLADQCTGCDLCVEPCPVDCIEMRPIATTTQNWKWDLESIPVRMVQ